TEVQTCALPILCVLLRVAATHDLHTQPAVRVLQVQLQVLNLLLEHQHVGHEASDDEQQNAQRKHHQNGSPSWDASMKCSTSVVALYSSTRLASAIRSSQWGTPLGRSEERRVGKGGAASGCPA